MDVNELRRGNLVFLLKKDTPKRIVKVSGITSTMIACKEIVAEYDIFEPIPLTEELLLKFGFEKFSNSYTLGNLRINSSLDVEWGGNWMGIRLKYVHELQNLYFALTNQELEMKQ